jgi:hypothetical protein
MISRKNRSRKLVKLARKEAHHSLAEERLIFPIDIYLRPPTRGFEVPPLLELYRSIQ